MRRRRTGMGKRNVTYRISHEVVEKMDLLTFDPLHNRNRVGLKSAVVEALLRKLIEARKANDAIINVRDILEQLP
jgi:hypothetical protein